MTDSYLGVPDALLPRLVRRWPENPYPGMAAPDHHRRAVPYGGAYATARDMAVFGQMFLDRGRYGRARILSPASAAEMTRNQIPGVDAYFGGVTYPGASWGYGWTIQGNGTWPYYSPTLCSPRMFWHTGLGGFFMWVDPVYEIVGVYCAVVTRQHASLSPVAAYDLFANSVTAAVTETTLHPASENGRRSFGVSASRP
jgi:CubicO group peptidase (beta-lactamase class C family)